MAIEFTTDLTLSKSGFVFDHSTGLTYTLNATGQFILGRLQNGANPDDILLELTEEFEVPEATARKDIDDFQRQLRELGLAE